VLKYRDEYTYERYRRKTKDMKTREENTRQETREREKNYNSFIADETIRKIIAIIDK
jgi:hypothetical protein